eukprot:5460149-Alexandrium_andersonii.AAC.1
MCAIPRASVVAAPAARNASTTRLKAALVRGRCGRPLLPPRSVSITQASCHTWAVGRSTWQVSPCRRCVNLDPVLRTAAVQGRVRPRPF